MKKLYVILIAFLLISIDLFGQQKPIFSQYSFNPLAINPAFAGSQDIFSSSALYRNQWVNLDGAPTISTLTANSGIGGKRIGLGFLLSHDQVGVHSDLSLYLSYAFRIKFKNGALAMGLQAGFNSLKSDFSKLTLQNITDPNLNGIFSKFNPNFGAGVFYDNGPFYAGVSVPYLINSKFFNSEVEFSEAKSKRYYFILVGRVFDLHERLEVKPETLIRLQEGAPLGIDLNLKFILDKKIAVGGSYRSGDAFITTFELQLNDNLRLGYAYEWTLSSLSQFSRGSHEFMLNYRIKINGLNGRQDCPTYF